MYGKQNDDLSYLGHLTEHAVELAEIPHSTHFPMHSKGTDELRRSSLAVAPGSAGILWPPDTLRSSSLTSPLHDRTPLELIPGDRGAHSWACHRPWAPDRVVIGKLM